MVCINPSVSESKTFKLWRRFSSYRSRATSRCVSQIVALCTVLLVVVFGVRTSAATQPVQFLGTPAQVFTSGIAFPIGMAEDASGNVYIAEYEGNAVYKETLQGNGSYVRSTVDSGFSAGPVGLAIDSAGNVYVGIDDNSANSSLIKETLQGNGTFVRSYMGSGLGDVYGIEVDASGNVFVAQNDETESVIKFVLSGSTYTPSTIYTSSSGILAGLALDSSGNVFVAKEYGNVIYKLTPSGDAATTTSYTASTITIGTGVSIFDVALDSAGDLFIANTDGDIRLETPNGGLSYTETIIASGLSTTYGITVGPTGAIYFGVSGAVDEFAPAAVNLGSPNLKVISSTFSLVYTIQPEAVVSAIHVVSQGVVNTQMGSPEFVNAGGGSCTAQTYSNLTACTVKVAFTPQFTGLQTGAVQFLDADGNVLSNVFLYGIGKAPVAAFSAGTAAVLSVTGLGATPLSGPRHPVMDVAGNLYIADSGNNRIVKVAPGGAATVVSTPSFTLDNPTGVALDGAGNLYIADSGNGRVVELSAQGAASALNTNSLALANNYGVAVDGLGNVYTSDATNNRVIEFPNIGSAHVLATTGVTLGAAYGVAADGSGNVYIADESGSRIVKVAAGVGTVLGTGTLSPALANPTDVAVDAAGNVYIADGGNDRIVEVSSATTSGIALGTGGFTLNGPNCAVVGNVEDLYICDAGNDRILSSNQEAAASLSFATPNTTQAIRLLNLGNLSLTLSVPTSGKNPSFGAGNFTFPSAGNTGYCPQLSTTSAAANLAAGANCILSVEFAPVEGATGTLTDTLTIKDNALGVAASTQTISLSGSALPTPTVTVTPLPAAPIAYGQAQTSLGVLVSYSSGTPSGTVSFTDSSNSLGSAITLSAGAGTFAAQYYLPGAHSFRATYSGDSNFDPASSSTVSYTVNKASSAVSGPAGTVSVVHGASGSITSTVAGQFSGAGIIAPSGSVTYSIADSGSNVVASGSATIAAGSATVPVASTLAFGTFTVTLNYAGDSNYSAAAAATANLHIGLITPAIHWAQPPQITYGTTLSGVLNATATNNSTPVPGTFAYTATPAGGSASSVTAASILRAGSYALTVAFTPSETSTYGSASATVTLSVSKATPVLSWPAPSALTFGATLASVLDPAASFNLASVPGTFTYIATPAAGNAATVTAASQLAAGSYSLVATFTPADATDYANGGTASVGLTVNRAATTTQLSSSMNPGVVQNPTTLTLLVTSPAGVPTGTVTFLDGTTPIGSAPVSSGIATLTLSSLGIGSHSISAAYSGDTNFSSAVSSILTQMVLDFAATPVGGGSSGSGGGTSTTPSQTVLPGGAATYSLSIVPTSGVTFPIPMVFTVSGLPPGSQAAISPASWIATSSTSWTLPANTAVQSVELIIQLPSTTARNQPQTLFPRALPGILCGLLLLPLAGSMRRASRRLGRWKSLLIVAVGGCALMGGISGCGSGSGFFNQSPQVYAITETVTAGALSHSTTVTLTIE